MKRKKKFDFAYLKGKTSGRKGMGMELALLVLLVVFGCSILLVGSAMMGKNALQQQEQQLFDQLTIDQLAETILADDSVDAAETKYADYAAFKKNNDGNFEPVLHGSGITLSEEFDFGEDVVLVITDGSGDLLLTVAMDGNKITQWSYH